MKYIKTFYKRKERKKERKNPWGPSLDQMKEGCSLAMTPDKWDEGDRETNG
jgi:hypothetical protein